MEEAHVDDEAHVEDEPLVDIIPEQETQIPQVQDFGVTYILSSVVEFVSSNGWYLLVTGVILAYIWYTYVKPRLDKYKQQRSDWLESAEQHKNPDLLVQRHEAMEAARRRMQESHDVKASEQAEKIKQKEEIKKQSKIEEWDKHRQGLGYHSKAPKPSEAASVDKSKTSQKPKAKLRPEYNPMLGNLGNPSRYQPSRRGGGSGGG